MLGAGRSQCVLNPCSVSEVVSLFFQQGGVTVCNPFLGKLILIKGHLCVQHTNGLVV